MTIRKDCNPASWTPIGTGRKLGIEIECAHDNGDEIVFSVEWESMLDGKYVPAVKADGSIDGAEFVTQPADLVTHKKCLPILLKQLDDLEFYSDDDCGVHVHVERKSQANQKLTAMLLKLIMTSTTWNGRMYNGPWSDFLEAIHGRDVTCNDYCTSSGSYMREGTETLMDIFKRNPEKFDVNNWALLQGHKYWRINFLHKDTYEFRMGDGSMQEHVILRYAEFALAAVTWVEEMGDKLFHVMMEQEVEMFKNWVHQHNVEYPILSAFLQQRYYLT